MKWFNVRIIFTWNFGNNLNEGDGSVLKKTAGNISVLLIAVVFLTVINVAGVCFAAGSEDNLVGRWERYGDGAEGTIVAVEKVDGKYQSRLEKVTGTLTTLGFIVNDLKWKEVVWKSDTSYEGLDMFRYEAGGYEYRKSSLYINANGVLQVSVANSGDTDVIIGTYQTWRKLNSSTSGTDSRPGNLRASLVNGKVFLQWEAGLGGIKGYNLYRGKYSGGEEATPISDFPIEATSYTDANVDAGYTYYYFCRAVNTNNAESANSNEASVVVNSKRQIVLQIGNAYMTVNGAAKEIDPGRGTTPVIVNGRTILPIRALIEELGGTVGWEGSTQKVTVQLNQKTIELFIGSKTTLINGQEKATDVPPQIINSRTMVPLRYVIDNLGYEVLWDSDTKSVTINY